MNDLYKGYMIYRLKTNKNLKGKQNGADIL